MAHLQDHADQDDAFTSALTAGCLPPNFETPNPVLRTADAFAVWLVKRLVVH